MRDRREKKNKLERENQSERGDGRSVEMREIGEDFG